MNTPSPSTPDGTPPTPPAPHPHAGGIVHSYQKYDPKNFPSPTAPAPDLASAAFEHMLMFGGTEELTPEQLAKAIRLDPSMFPSLGPSLQALRAMLEERKRKILETYETRAAQQDAAQRFKDAAAQANPPKQMKGAFLQAVRDEQIAELERLYYRNRDDQSEFAQDLVGTIAALGNKYEIEELASKYAFTGREAMDVETALAVKEELETIDKLLEQLKEAQQNAQLAIIDMDELAQYAEPGQMEALNRLQQQIEDYIREEAARQGLDQVRGALRLSPRALRLFQQKLLSEIFSDLQAARSGRHALGVEGEGATELQRTRPYEFGDSPAHIDPAQTVINASLRGLPARVDDIEIHRTRNNPKCATTVIMDMSGSMRYDGQYIACKRMALALDGLIRAEYPGDHLSFVEMYSLAKLRPAADVPALMPKPVSIHSPRVRLKADMSNPRMSELQLPQHFTNIQHALQLSRQVLSVQDTPNRQIFLITDGLPTAHFEGRELFFLYPPDPLTEQATMREAALCQREGITINIFLLPNWSQSSEDIRFAHRLAERTRGRVFFPGGTELDRFVVWDYVKQRRRMLG